MFYLAKKSDIIKHTIYDIKDAVVDVIEDTNELCLSFPNSEEDIGSIKLTDIFREFIGEEVSFKLGGSVKVTNELFPNTDDSEY